MTIIGEEGSLAIGYLITNHPSEGWRCSGIRFTMPDKYSGVVDIAQGEATKNVPGYYGMLADLGSSYILS